jgi:formiminoglutamase
MSGESSSAAGWSSKLDPARPPTDLAHRPDDLRLGEVVEFWRGDPAALRPGRAVLLGFPQDEGVRRNHGRAGAAEAPDAIRPFLYRLTPWGYEPDVDLTLEPPLDAGNIRIEGSLEETQAALAHVIGGILRAGAVPIVLGGGHETAYGHYLGYLDVGRDLGIINIDAHLDMRPCPGGLGTSGTPFRQCLEHPRYPLEGNRYVCLGAQPQAVSRAHWQLARHKGCVIAWGDKIGRHLSRCYAREQERLAAKGAVYLSIDADAAHMSDVPGVSAPNPSGLSAEDIAQCALLAGSCPAVTSIDVVEINPRFDRDGQSARWAARVVWSFLMGLAQRPAGNLGSSQGI